MLKINQKIKNKCDELLRLLVVILIILLSRTNTVYGANRNWLQISKTPAGIQYIDRNSLNTKGEGIIELTSKYLKIDPNSSKKIEENIYIMKINCLTNKFKNISVNGKKNLTVKW